MDTRVTKHQLKVQEWQAIILKRSESGLSVREFCKVHQLDEKRYFYWQHVIRMEAQASMSLPNVTASEEPDVIFAPLDVSDSTQSTNSSSSGLTLQVGSITIGVTEATSPVVLKKTLQVLREMNGSW